MHNSNAKALVKRSLFGRLGFKSVQVRSAQKLFHAFIYAGACAAFAFAVVTATPAKAASNNQGIDSTSSPLYIAVNGQTALTLNTATPYPTVSFSGPLLEGSTTINVDGSMVLSSNNGTNPVLNISGNTTATGNITLSGNLTANQITIGQSTATSTTIELANQLVALKNNGGCSGNQVIAMNSSGTLYCAHGQGGIYTTGSNCNDNACRYANPQTGACTCPSGFAATEFWEYESNSATYADSNLACALAATIHWVKVYQCE